MQYNFNIWNVFLTYECILHINVNSKKLYQKEYNILYVNNKPFN